MKNLILTFACFTMIQVLSAQTTATWMGGTPGKPTAWNCATNWKENRIPDENAQVIIPADRHYYPILIQDVIEIDALLVAGGAKMIIQSGSTLSILGESGRLNGATIQGCVVNEGRIFVENQSGQFSLDAKKNISGNGTAYFSEHMVSSQWVQK